MRSWHPVAARRGSPVDRGICQSATCSMEQPVALDITNDSRGAFPGNAGPALPGGKRQRLVVGGGSVCDPPKPAAELGARRMGGVVVAELAALEDGIDQRQPGLPDRRASATAAARFSSTTGEGVGAKKHVVERDDPRPVRLGESDGRPACSAAIAAWIAKDPTSPAGETRLPTSASPSPIRARSQQRAVLVLEQDRLAVGVRARAARRRFVQQHQAPAGRSPPDPAAARPAAAPSRIASADRSGRVSRGARGRRVAFVEDEVDDAQHIVEALGSRRGPALHRGCAPRGSSPWPGRCAGRSSAPR